MRYEGTIYRPPSEAYSYILQATVGCSWNACTYCDMYRAKRFRVRDVEESLEDIRQAGERFGDEVDKVFVADGDALILDVPHWTAILEACRATFPRLRRVSAYATAMNLLQKTPEELQTLRELGLSLLYIGPESGDDTTLKRIAKGASFDDHVVAARRAHAAGMRLSAIFLLGAGGTERSAEHAEGSARLATAMDPRFVSLLTLTVVPGTPIARRQEKGTFTLPRWRGCCESWRPSSPGPTPRTRCSARTTRRTTCAWKAACRATAIGCSERCAPRSTATCRFRPNGHADSSGL